MKSRKLILSLFIILIFGLALYLPFLGEKEFQGEEGRRVLIALQMLEKGEYLLPTLFDEPYFNKPPLFNWALASFFIFTSNYSEFTARALSSFALIFTALFLTYIWYRILKKLSFNEDILYISLPGLIFLTTPEIIDKALRAEIDAFYTALITLSLFIWFYYSEVRCQKNKAYLFSGFFLGLAVLTKTFQAIIFFYLTLIPYLIWQKKFKEFFSLPHLIGLIALWGVFLLWAIPISFKIGFMPFLEAWIMEYFSAAKGQAMSLWQHLEAYTLSAFLGFSPWIIFFPVFRVRAFRDFLDRTPIFLKLFYFSLFFFGFSYLFHFLFPGARLRYMLPSIGGFVYLGVLTFLFYFSKPLEFSKKLRTHLKMFSLLNLILAIGALFYLKHLNFNFSLIFYFFYYLFILINIFYFLKQSYTYRTFFIFLIIWVFLIKQFFVSLYYPYHQKNMDYFRNAAFKIVEHIENSKTLYLCKTMPHHLIYYLKYKYKLVNEIKYLKFCDKLPQNAYVLIQENDLSEEFLKSYKSTAILIRNKKYYLLHTAQ